MDVKLIDTNTGKTVMEAEAMTSSIVNREKIEKEAQKNLVSWQIALNDLMDSLDSLMGVEIFCPEEYLGLESGFGTEIKQVSLVDRQRMTVQIQSNSSNEIYEWSVGKLADIIAEFGFIKV